MEDEGCSCGVVEEERARCMAAADGVVLLKPVTLGGRLGLLLSALFLREREPLLAAADIPEVRGFGRAGDGSREEFGDAAGETARFERDEVR